MGNWFRKKNGPEVEGSCVEGDSSDCEPDEVEAPEGVLCGSVSLTLVTCPLRLPRTCYIIPFSSTAGADELEPANCVLCMVLAPSI
ncbi:hypothetical protein TIFTF001_039060 [Ficus carica]|uniref:Uncharacterized protein n=1 Tax=Ficus carica TaxID=3494 RepID=A0AA88EBP0_FICCA|nr:hypothetical protein TIFTF001_039060 [Ficus carica]